MTRFACLTAAAVFALALTSTADDRKTDSEPSAEQVKPKLPDLLYQKHNLTADDAAVFQKQDFTIQDALNLLAEKGGFAFRVNEHAFVEAGGKSEDRLNLTLLSAGDFTIAGGTWASLLHDVAARMGGESDSQATWMVRGDHLELTTVAAQLCEVLKGREYGKDVPPIVSVSFKKRPIDEVFDELSDRSGMNIILDSTTAKETAKLPITARFMNTPVDTVARLCANMAGLKVYEMDNVIYITSPQRVETLEKEQQQLIKKRRIVSPRGGAKSDSEGSGSD